MRIGRGSPAEIPAEPIDPGVAYTLPACDPSAAPPATIRWFRERGIQVNHLWGMTEMTPVGTVGAPPANWDEMSEQERLDAGLDGLGDYLPSSETGNRDIGSFENGAMCAWSRERTVSVAG